MKRDLRTYNNIDNILDTSRDQTALKREIDRLVDLEEEVIFEKRKEMAWLVVTCIATLTGLVNVIVALGWI